MVLGIKTLELARVHEEALAKLNPSRSSKRLLVRAEIFFAAVNAVIKESRHATGETASKLKQIMASLRQRTEDLAASNRQLKTVLQGRKVMKNAFEQKAEVHQQCLEESLDLQKRLRQLTHKVLTAQEDERKKISHELQDEIAQTLLGINVRLRSLTKEGKSNNTGLKNNIASTRQLVARSVKAVRVVANRLGKA